MLSTGFHTHAHVYILNTTLIVYTVKEVVLFNYWSRHVIECVAGRIKVAWLHVVYVENETSYIKILLQPLKVRSSK